MFRRSHKMEYTMQVCTPVARTAYQPSLSRNAQFLELLKTFWLNRFWLFDKDLALEGEHESKLYRKHSSLMISKGSLNPCTI